MLETDFTRALCSTAPIQQASMPGITTPELVAAARPHVGALPALAEEVSAAESKLETLSVAEPAAAEAVVARPVEIALSDLAAATDGFADGKLIGSGGFSHVYEASADLHLSLAAPPQLRHLPLVVKRAKSGLHIAPASVKR